METKCCWIIFFYYLLFLCCAHFTNSRSLFGNIKILIYIEWFRNHAIFKNWFVKEVLHTLYQYRPCFIIIKALIYYASVPNSVNLPERVSKLCKYNHKELIYMGTATRPLPIPPTSLNYQGASLISDDRNMH